MARVESSLEIVATRGATSSSASRSAALRAPPPRYTTQHTPVAMDEERRLAQRRAEERIGALLPRPGPRAAAVSVWWLLGL